MCDFHNFSLIFSGQMHCLPQRLKSTLFEFFSNGGCPKGTRSVEKISNNIDFSLWGNRATTWEYFLTFSSETKIMKIRHSVIWIVKRLEKSNALYWLYLFCCTYWKGKRTPTYECDYFFYPDLKLVWFLHLSVATTKKYSNIWFFWLGINWSAMGE